MRAARRARAAVVRGGAAALGLALVALLAVTLGALAVKGTGHQLLVVTSGSMEPYFSAGDALVVDRLHDTARANVAPGDVVTFRPLSGGGLVTHRVVALRTVQGVPFVQTRGDANPVVDADLTPLSAVVARTQRVLPEAGRAVVLLEDPRLRAWLYGLPMLLVMAWSLRDLLGSGGLLRSPIPFGPRPVGPGVGLGRNRVRRAPPSLRRPAGLASPFGSSSTSSTSSMAWSLDLRRPIALGAGAIVAISLLGLGAAPTRALFQDTAAVAANTFTTGTWGCDALAYPNAVIARSPYAYWRLGDSAGSTTAANTSGAGPTLTRAGTITFGAPGLLCSADTAATWPSGGTRYLRSPATFAGPASASVSTWVSTSGSLAGRIVGFGDGLTVLSTTYDRHLLRDSAGRLGFGVRSGGVARIVWSPLAYNDGQRHHVVGTVGALGLRLYVDGVLVASDPAVLAADVYAGAWRIGDDNVDGWGIGSGPPSRRFTGTIDEVAVFHAQLTDADVAALHSAG
jgi:signal peptidase I